MQNPGQIGNKRAGRGGNEGKKSVAKNDREQKFSESIKTLRDIQRAVKKILENINRGSSENEIDCTIRELVYVGVQSQAELSVFHKTAVKNLKLRIPPKQWMHIMARFDAFNTIDCATRKILDDAENSEEVFKCRELRGMRDRKLPQFRWEFTYGEIPDVVQEAVESMVRIVLN